jgi:hypothetical protein
MTEEKTIVPLEVDRATKHVLVEWMEKEDRKSTRGHAAVVLRRVARVYRERPEELERLGIKEKTR